MKSVKKIKLKKDIKGKKGSVFNPVTNKYDKIVSKLSVGNSDYERCKSCKELSNNFLVNVLESGYIYYHCGNCKAYIFLSDSELT